MELGTGLTQFLIEQQRKYPSATGDFTSLLSEIATAAKVLSREVNKAGLIDILGFHGKLNVHGEAVQKLDQFANDTFIKVLRHTGHLIGIASEEMEEPYQIPDAYPKGKYVFLMDPLDGSSNIDVNISIGSIFAIYRRKSVGAHATTEDFLQKGRDQVCAGYIIYGSSTMMVYTTGFGVHGFTLDPGIGEFLLSHENIRIPSRGSIYSINEGNEFIWGNGVGQYIKQVKKEGKTARYVGSLVADFHRNLLKGGIFLYPADAKNKNGKLRLLYEASPLAFIVEQAQGKGSDGRQMILDIAPDKLHQ
ncbi:MAG: class 1 fructose-bisphosphatase, partial [Nitrospirae bacterium]|nr:class 1 fructose-bisphosphatase [Candidatus Troglogloeales bacterium]